MNRIAMLALLAGLVSVGCTDIRDEYPTWPAWGWWDAPATPADAPAEPAPTEPEPTEVDPPAEPVEAAVLTAADMERRDEHRQSVWVTVKKLRDLDEMPKNEQAVLLSTTRASLPGWYKPIQAQAPNLNDPDWVTMVVWDFMPDYEFIRMREFWRKTAEARNLEFPDQPDRRTTALWVLEFTRRQTSIPPVGTVPPTQER